MMKTHSSRQRKTRTLMIQGTSSFAGKSVLTAALCRILRQDGLRVAPFKAQNMSLNSFVTREGKEMGRAQVVQAQAARLDPDARMNPILLKPASNTVCQVMAEGKPLGHMDVEAYFAYHPQAFAIAQQNFDSLAREYEVIILEGAGSPAEVNLKDHDFVNMAMAHYAQAPVIIVGDIDRGGVFASFVGTHEILNHQEQALVAGWVINKFRGDDRLLTPALDYMLTRTGKPVLGIVPYMDDLALPEEDGVEFEARAYSPARPQIKIQIAVIHLPHVSNMTDFDALRMEEDVELRIIHSEQDLNAPQAVIIPGSKNTLSDLAYLKNSGLAERILGLARNGQTEIIGICAGFQMLGAEIFDPQGIESSGHQAAGLGLLKITTHLRPEKTLMQTRAKHELSGLEVSGYEIHHGETNLAEGAAAFIRSDGQIIGTATADHAVWGTYLHGLFDIDLFRRWLINRLRIKSGWPASLGPGRHYDIEPALDHLAQVVRQSLAMEKIYACLELA